MITKNDCLLLLSEIKDRGIDITKEVRELMQSQSIPIEVLKFINNNRPLELTQFYDKIRKSYNNKKSSLYKNIVREDLRDPSEIIITLSSLNLQILLFAKKLDSKILFLKHSRAKEINLVLAKYYSDYDLTNCLKLLSLIKADLKACEEIIKS